MTDDEVRLVWLGAAYGLLEPGWQATYRVIHRSQTHTVVVGLSEDETAAIAALLGQAKLEKRQAELVLQHGGRERILAALQRGEIPERVDIVSSAAGRGVDMARWHVGR